MCFHSAFALYGCILHLYFVCVNKIFIVFLYLSFLLVFYKILSEFSTFLLYTFSLAVARFPRQSGVKTRIHLIEVLTVQLILERLESFTESLEVYYFSRPQEPDRIRNLRNIPHNPQDIVVGAPCFLFWGDLVSTTYTKI